MKKYALIVMILVAVISASAQQKSPFAVNTPITEEVATKYFNSYMAIDWDALATFMHDEITFDDPTADLLFGEKKPVGKTSVLKNFRETFAAITNMTPTLSRTFVSGNIAVFEMDLSFSFRNQQNGTTTINMPLVVVITVKDGKVIAHRDYGDYREYISQLRAERAKQTSTN